MQLIKISYSLLSLVMIVLSTSTKIQANEENCVYSYNRNDVKLTWSGFKTPKKIAVSGSFKKIELLGPIESTSLNNILLKSSFSIDGMLIDSQNPQRDKNLLNSLFSTLANFATIRGFFQNIKGVGTGTIDLHLNFNGVTQILPMEYIIKDNVFNAKVNFDLLKFNMQSEVNNLSELCKTQHENKTWSEVLVEIVVPFSKKC